MYKRPEKLTIFTTHAATISQIMKAGVDLNMKKSADSSFEKEHNSGRNRWTLVIVAIISVVVVSLSVLAGVYLGAKLARRQTDDVKEHWPAIKFQTLSGEVVPENITFTVYEKDITNLKENVRFIYDYNRGFLTMRVSEDGHDSCYVATFDRRSLTPPPSKIPGKVIVNVTTMSEIDYFVDEKSVVDHTVLSQRSRDMCDGLPMYWMDRDYHQGNADSRRQKRACKRVCSLSCSGGSGRRADCRVECRIRCTF